ncbi:AAA family ATPase [Streptococcus sp. 210928-DFI.4.42]|uniref:McrB family protein n=1 Tax=Streptococcus sp. 210928-DFI.4.42 TaxID=2883234 RepID=UPI001D09763C|nr:AAA family ATPase [Streptococcus sp. 210928-DFI.4.42]MCB7060796.1 AAA family ATPase [Streptococcus sp. 210928-DFI.4.42]
MGMLEKYELTISSNEINSTDSRFTMDNLSLGDDYKIIDVKFETADGQIIKRRQKKFERKISNQTLPRLTCQIFEQQLLALSNEERKKFPICKYRPTDDMIQGIFSSIDDFKENRNTLEYLTYECENGESLVFYCWNIFSTLIFVKECLKRFGTEGDKFILIYKDKGGENEVMESGSQTMAIEEHIRSYSDLLLSSKNIVFRGAPGTGKTYLSKQIASYIVSNGRTSDINSLSQNEINQIDFVQFHPSYDYTDFVEGFRPSEAENNQIGFSLKPGKFKEFIGKAQKFETADRQDNFAQAWGKFFEAVTEAMETSQGYNELKTLTGKPMGNIVSYDKNGIQGVFKKGTTQYLNYNQIYNVYRGLPGVPEGGLDNYRKAVVKHLREKFGLEDYIVGKVKNDQDKFVFIIDEINRGEISKIFGELFFSIDPDYRGFKGAVSTPYNSEEKLYIPENVYIIGTMNDIDRSVETFDFAMRRRFTFVEITADQSAQNMQLNEETKEIMYRLNNAIVEEGHLTQDYQIGASYFKNLDEGTLSIKNLWDYKLKPLLNDYFRGERLANDKMRALENAYFGTSED